MKFTIVIAALLASSQAVLLQHHTHSHDLSTGNPIPICNGANSGNCVEADEVVKHRLRRPHKRAGPNDADWAAQEKADAARK